jgi:hypothetical protein
MLAPPVHSHFTLTSQQTIFGSHFFNFDSETSKIKMSDKFLDILGLCDPHHGAGVIDELCFPETGEDDRKAASAD